MLFNLEAILIEFFLKMYILLSCLLILNALLSILSLNSNAGCSGISNLFSGKSSRTIGVVNVRFVFLFPISAACLNRNLGLGCMRIGYHELSLYIIHPESKVPNYFLRGI